MGLNFWLIGVLLLQKAMLLQQSTWQNNVRMSNLVEQVWVIDRYFISLISLFLACSDFSFLKIQTRSVVHFQVFKP